MPIAYHKKMLMKGVFRTVAYNVAYVAMMGAMMFSGMPLAVAQEYQQEQQLQQQAVNGDSMIMTDGAMEQELDAAEAFDPRTEEIGGLISNIQNILKRMRAPADVARQGIRDDGRFADGTELLMRAQLGRNTRLQGDVYAILEDGMWMASLSDVVALMNFPIMVYDQGERAEGWFLRENNLFKVDVAAKTVQAGERNFRLSPRAYADGMDIMVPMDDVWEWFGIDWSFHVGAQMMTLEPRDPLPLQQWLERQKRMEQRTRTRVPRIAELPPAPPVDDKVITLPVFDISTRSTLNRRANQNNDSDLRNTAIISAKSGLGEGTANMLLTLSDQENQSQIRGSYLRESENPDLLGPLQARRYQVGDINPVRVPLADRAGQGTSNFGARVTNRDRFDNLFSPLATIEGEGLPGWDVELYRDNILVDLQTIDSDGRYRFDEVALFDGENEVRLVFYGPQGEIREERRDLFFDRRLENAGGRYDISVTQRRFVPDLNDRDDDRPDDRALNATFEAPINDVFYGDVGLRAWENQGEDRATVSAGLSTTLNSVYLDGRSAVDDDGATAFEFSARRGFGQHSVINTTNVTDKNFVEKSNENPDIFENRTFISGPLDFMGLGRNARYNNSFTYRELALGDKVYTASAGFGMPVGPVNLNQSFDWNDTRSPITGDEKTITGNTALSGFYMGNRLRLNSRYRLSPEYMLENISANLNRRFTRQFSADFGVQRQIENKVTEYSVRANYETSFATLSPTIRYDNNSNLFVGLNTRMGLMPEPRSGDYYVFPRAIGERAAVSARVFLDLDGDGKFSDGDELIEKAQVSSVQSRRRALTNEKGVALLTDLTSNYRTDIVIEPQSLSDPFWIPAVRGYSVLPRTGTAQEVDLPVYLSGEIEGVVVGLDQSGNSSALRQTRMDLIDSNGEIALTTYTAVDGIYIFSMVPPGDYLLRVDGADARRYGFAPPVPKKIHIGFDGTEIYGADFKLEEGLIIPYLVMAQDKKPQDTDVVLHLGQYTTKILRAVGLYRLRQIETDMLSQAKIELEDTDDDKQPYTLRAYWPRTSLAEAHRACAAIIAREVDCAIELASNTAHKDNNLILTDH